MTALGDTLRQMLAVLETERQALAAIDLDGIMGAATDKAALCGTLDDAGVPAIDEEARGLLDAARRLNEVNRQVRNLLAANVSARLDALTGSPRLYRADPPRKIAPAYAVAGARR
ncbi:MAG: flagellar protein FlgN [Novosphingobium sp.]|nr:flagellar protein FlgN [Novosphingobium sp.]